MKISKNEKLILECFENCPIPSFIKTEDRDGLDLMYCYEDLRNYITDAKNNKCIDTKLDSWGEGKNFIFDGKYEKLLLDIIINQHDTDLKFHCALTLTVLQILIKYSDLT